MTKSYCTQNNGDCSTCSLVNYGRDCRNISIAASILGKLGGSAKSERKTAAVRANGKKGGRPREILGRIYAYDNGQTPVEFRRGGPRDWFIWLPARGQRLATYPTQRELMAALARIEAAYPDDMPNIYQIRVELLSSQEA